MKPNEKTFEQSVMELSTQWRKDSELLNRIIEMRPCIDTFNDAYSISLRFPEKKWLLLTCDVKSTKFNKSFDDARTALEAFVNKWREK